MKRKKLFAFLLLLPSLFVSAQSLRFDNNGDLKIMQLTDIHYRVAKPNHSAESLAMINRMLDREKPDVVMLTGDIVVDSLYREGWSAVLTPIVSRNIPFAVTFGNHDDEFGTSRRDLMAYIRTFKGCLNAFVGDSVCFDGAVAVAGSSDEATKALLYIFDSNAYSTVKGLEGYGWFSFGQVNRYLDLSRKFTAANNNKPLPALAFFHIPLVEYRTYCDTDSLVKSGNRGEKECAGALNTGMYAAMKLAGDVFGTFCGHDHNNDYVVDAGGIALVYGRFSGSKNTYTDFEKGVRIIILKEDLRCFTTKVVLESGNETAHIGFPQ